MEAANCTFDNVVKTTVLLADINDFKAVNEVYTTFFTDNYPARAAYQVRGEETFLFLLFFVLSGGGSTAGSQGGDRSRGCGWEDHHCSVKNIPWLHQHWSITLIRTFTKSIFVRT